MATKKQFSSFQELVSNSDVPLLVDFYAPWCGPCQMMSNILEQVNPQVKQQVRIVRINTETYPDLASQYNIHALPTLVLFKAGRAIDRLEGVVSAPELVQYLQAQTGAS